MRICFELSAKYSRGEGNHIKDLILRLHHSHHIWHTWHFFTGARFLFTTFFLSKSLHSICSSTHLRRSFQKKSKLDAKYDTSFTTISSCCNFVVGVGVRTFRLTSRMHEPASRSRGCWYFKVQCSSFRRNNSIQVWTAFVSKSATSSSSRRIYVQQVSDHSDSRTGRSIN